MNRIKYFITIAFLSGVIIFALFFLWPEPPQRFRQGFQRQMFESVLPGAIEKAARLKNGTRMESGGISIAVPSDSEEADLLKKYASENDSYYDENKDCYIFIREITGEAGHRSLARIEVSGDSYAPDSHPMRTRRTIMKVIIISIASLAIFFVYFSYRKAGEAEQKSEKFQDLQKLYRGLAHEIRNPLNTMHLSLELLSREEANIAVESRDDFNEYVGIIKSEIRRLDELLRRFMDYARELRVARSRFDVSELVRTVCTTLLPVAEEKNISISIDAVADTLIDADREMLYQCLFNLVKNSIEAIKKDGHIAVSAKKAGGVEICVEDNGQGIPPASASKIFNFYFSTKSEGSGIGLALSKKFIEAHGGTISFESASGRTVFTIKLPV